LDKQARHFEKDGKLSGLYYLWEAMDSFFYSLGKSTSRPVHVRDGMDLKRMMVTVMFAPLPERPA